MDDACHLHGVLQHTVYDTVVVVDEFTEIGVAVLGHDPPELRKRLGFSAARNTP